MVGLYKKLRGGEAKQGRTFLLIKDSHDLTKGSLCLQRLKASIDPLVMVDERKRVLIP